VNLFVRKWPFFCLFAALILNLCQLFVSPFTKIINQQTIESALISGTRSFSHTWFGDCSAQLSYLASKIGDKSIVLGGVNPVFWIELLLLATTFLIVFLAFLKARL